jgi:cyclophilin family peptidyl-prolyl cis-trans isomerase
MKSAVTLLLFTALQVALFASPQSLAIASQDAAEPDSSAAAASATDDYDVLRKAFENLRQSLQNQGGIAKGDHEIIRAFQSRAEAFSAAHPDDARPIAMLLQMARWLKENDRFDELYERLLALREDDVKLRLAWAQYHRQLNNYARALEIVEAGTYDLAKNPEVATLKSDLLFAENRFQEAVDALNSVPLDQITDPAAKVVAQSSIDRSRLTREQYVTFWAAETALREAEAAKDDLPRVEIVTAKGPIIVELFEDNAPNTVANFISLAETEFYNGTKFHRVLDNFMAQGGDPNTKADAPPGAVPGQGGPGYFIMDEVGDSNPRKHYAGSLSMANSGPNSNGSQFFITFEPTPHLNGKHTVFGRVIEGLSTARSLKPNDVIESIEILRKREHEYRPEVMSSVPPAPPASIASPDPNTGIKLPGNTATPE